MSIKVIGAGFGRTGTYSLKLALEKLGYNKCYHMKELFSHPEKIVHWKQLQKGNTPDWEDLFNGYQAIVDFPSYVYYKQLLRQYPEAKVILTVRNPEEWYTSSYNTIYQIAHKGVMKLARIIMSLFYAEARIRMPIYKFEYQENWKEIFNNRFEDRAFAIAKFNLMNEDVIKNVPKDKLLVMNIKEGWEPLCKFLNKPIPDEPFPHANDTKEFHNRTKYTRRLKKINY